MWVCRELLGIDHDMSDQATRRPDTYLKNVKLNKDKMGKLILSLCPTTYEIEPTEASGSWLEQKMDYMESLRSHS